ncbi:putative Squalene cyclase C-terminal domain-containing protein [Seiridium cardinale]
MESLLYVPRSDNTPTPLLDTTELLLEALETILRDCPPQKSYEPPLKGIWNGPTGIAYLFFHVSAARPELTIASKPALHWAQEYLAGTRDAEAMVLDPAVRTGVSSEALMYQALRASVSKEPADVKEFLAKVPAVLDGGIAPEWHSGRAGVLYLVRMISHWVSESAPLLHKAAALLRQSIMADGPDWKFNGRRYIGAVHGDVGTLTQLALTWPTDSEKQKLQEWLVRLLDWQKADGNWAMNEQSDPRPWVQFCHGAAGVVQSLRSIRHVFPDIRNKIDQAISRGSELVWKEGLLAKEPNLCHGAFGNSLALPIDRRKDFLAPVTPESIAEARKADTAAFEKANYGFEFALLTGYWPGAAWAWLVIERPDAGLIGYTDL